MKWRSVYRVIPVPIFYTDKMAADLGGYARGPVIWIRDKYSSDEGLHRHELEHVRQWWTLPILHGLLYKASDRYRLRAEARAYRIQMQHPDRTGATLTLEGAAARLMSRRYGLRITIGQAREALA